MPAGSDAATGSDAGFVGILLGTCLWCGHLLRYAKPGSPPADAEVDGLEFYGRQNTWRDLSLLDFPYDFGKYCPVRSASQPHPLGQNQVHQLVAGREGA